MGDAATKNVAVARRELACESVGIFAGSRRSIKIVERVAVKNQIVGRPLAERCRGGRDTANLQAGILVIMGHAKFDGIVITGDIDAIVRGVFDFEASHMPEAAVDLETARIAHARRVAIRFSGEIEHRFFAGESKDIFILRGRAAVRQIDRDLSVEAVGAAAHPDCMTRANTCDRVGQRGGLGLSAGIARCSGGGYEQIARRRAGRGAGGAG